MKPIRIVLDTNVYIAAAINPQSILYKVVEDSAAQYLGEYFTSPEILQELQNKLEEKFEFSRTNAVRWIASIEKSLTVLRPQKKLDTIKKDPEDNKILECAIEAQADLIISADKHLLKLKRFRGTKRDKS